ncbi:MAG: flavodoxin [Thermoplasmata archaeon]|nr:MAG: flavodoxin [Thermoplasmata archaeon]
MRKKVLIVYKSIHNKNTEKIANILGEILDGDTLRVEEIDHSILQDYDIIGFGSGIYFGKHHKSLFDFLERIDRMEKKAFIFSTRTLTPQTIAHKSLRRELTERGMEVIGEFSCKGESRVAPFKLFGGIYKGRPNEEDVQKAKIFAERLKNRL